MCHIAFDGGKNARDDQNYSKGSLIGFFIPLNVPYSRKKRGKKRPELRASEVSGSGLVEQSVQKRTALFWEGL